MKTVFMLLVFAPLTLFILLPVAYGEELDIKLVSFPPTHPGQEATIVVQTAANAHCEINVGGKKVQELSPKSANGQGRVSWTWTVDSKTAAGNWPIAVACSSEKQKGKEKTSFKGTLKTELVVK